MGLSHGSRRCLAILLFLALVGMQSWATYRLFTSRYPGGNDFYARWANGCALVWYGKNPYSYEVMQQTQIGMHGRPAEAGEDLAAFAYPLFTLFFFWPLCFIRAYPLVQAIWMTLMLYALLAGVVLTARVANWRPRRWLWAVTLAWSIFNYPHARALILGQMATLVFLGLALVVWALHRKKDILAGLALTVTTIKPQMSFLIIPWFLWWTAWTRRWGLWTGFSAAMLVLITVSLVLVPTWIGDFVEGVWSYRDSWSKPYDSPDQPLDEPESQKNTEGAPNYGSLMWIITRHLLKSGPVSEVIGLTVLTLYTSWVAWQERQAEWDTLVWVTGWVLIVTSFVAPRTATTHYTMLLLPLFAWFDRLEQSVGQRGWIAIVGVEAVLLGAQWVLFLTTLREGLEDALVYLPFPILMLIVQISSTRRSQEMSA